MHHSCSKEDENIDIPILLQELSENENDPKKGITLDDLSRSKIFNSGYFQGIIDSTNSTFKISVDINELASRLDLTEAYLLKINPEKS